MWIPVHGEEWDGDIPIGLNRPIASSSKDFEEGEVVFKGDTLPWKTGQYEVCRLLISNGSWPLTSSF